MGTESTGVDAVAGMLDAARELYEPLSQAAEGLGPDASVPRSAIESIVDAGLYGLMVPREVGGQELPLADLSTCTRRSPAPTARSAGSTSRADMHRGLLRGLPGRRGCRGRVRGRRAAHGGPVRTQRHRRTAPPSRATGWIVDGDYQFGSRHRRGGLGGRRHARHAGRRRRHRLPLRVFPRRPRSRSSATGTCSDCRRPRATTTRCATCSSPGRGPSTSSRRSCTGAGRSTSSASSA